MRLRRSFSAEPASPRFADDGFADDGFADDGFAEDGFAEDDFLVDVLVDFLEALLAAGFLVLFFVLFFFAAIQTLHARSPRTGTRTLSAITPNRSGPIPKHVS
ncbi:MAG: hypothetical protein AAGK04_05830 [Planctomycetota bacterium]